VEVVPVTKRKPIGASFGFWVERQITTAQDRGDFDNLPGMGKPLPKPTGRDSATEWVLRELKEKDLSAVDLLPPSLALPREIQDLPAKLAKVRAERQVREIVEDLNDRIRDAHRRPQDGPPLTVGLLDVEETVEEWRAARG
jgi:hypothetical protein